MIGLHNFQERFSQDFSGIFLQNYTTKFGSPKNLLCQSCSVRFVSNVSQFATMYRNNKLTLYSKSLAVYLQLKIYGERLRVKSYISLNVSSSIFQDIHDKFIYREYLGRSIFWKIV